MDITNSQITEYAQSLSSPELPLLKELREFTEQNVSAPNMLSGHLQGLFLSFISKIKNPKYILEIGTYTGYSALCLAKGLQKEGMLYSIDSNKETMQIATNFINRSAHASQISLILNKALDVLPTLTHPFDIIFIDADKNSYFKYYTIAKQLLNTNGIIIIDNTLWKGLVLQNTEEMNKQTIAIHNFNQQIAIDKEVTVIVLPIRDGITLVTKK